MASGRGFASGSVFLRRPGVFASDKVFLLRTDCSVASGLMIVGLILGSQVLGLVAPRLMDCAKQVCRRVDII